MYRERKIGMAKKLNWKIDVEGEEHVISLKYSMLFGKAIINIDGDEFDISTSAFKLRGSSQIFRLGEKQAILDFPKKGAPDIVIDGICVNSGREYRS